MKMKKDKVGENEVMRYDNQPPKRSENFMNLYINNTRFAYTKRDIQMLCSRISVTMEEEGSPVEEVAIITMTPAHAKAVMRALEANIKIYEEEYGEIAMSPDKE